LLEEMRDFLQWRRGDAILLAEANVPPEESANYFGGRGERLQMMLNFPVNQRLFYGLATGDVAPLRKALNQTREKHGCSQWAQFLRSHDELDLGRLSETQRQATFAALGPDPGMQLYGRGLRRRLAPMLGNDPRRIELALSLLFSLPGTPMMQYGDEIGIGENLELPDRMATRIPMQWSAERNGGFSRAEHIVRPVLEEGEFGYPVVNVIRQQRDRDSFLNTTERLIRMRQECPEIGWGDYEVLDHSPHVLVLKYHWRETSLITLHNFSVDTQTVDLAPGHAELGYDLFEDRADNEVVLAEPVMLPSYGYKWLRVGSPDASLQRAPF